MYKCSVYVCKPDYNMLTGNVQELQGREEISLMWIWCGHMWECVCVYIYNRKALLFFSAEAKAFSQHNKAHNTFLDVCPWTPLKAAQRLNLNVLRCPWRYIFIPGLQRRTCFMWRYMCMCKAQKCTFVCLLQSNMDTMVNPRLLWPLHSGQHRSINQYQVCAWEDCSTLRFDIRSLHMESQSQVIHLTWGDWCMCPRMSSSWPTASQQRSVPLSALHPPPPRPLRGLQTAAAAEEPARCR